MFEKLLEVGGARFHKGAVHEIVADDYVGHCQQQGHIRADADRQIEIGHLGQRDFARVGDDHFGTPFERLFNAGRRHGVALGHIGPDAEDQIGFVHVG